MGWPCKKCGNEETSVCPNCESIEPDARIAELEAENERMRRACICAELGMMQVCGYVAPNSQAFRLLNCLRKDMAEATKHRAAIEAAKEGN